MRRCIAVLLVAGAVVGCNRANSTPRREGAAPPTPGAIEGHVYLLDANGDVKRLASNTVDVLDGSDSLREELSLTCIAYAGLALPLLKRWHAHSTRGNYERDEFNFDYDHLLPRAKAEMDTLTRLRLATIVHIDSVLSAHRLGGAHTDIDAHFVIDSILPGHYTLKAEATVAEQREVWWKDIAIQPGEHLTADLDNDAVDPHRLYCGIFTPGQP